MTGNAGPPAAPSPWPGSATPLGATCDDEGTGFALFSASAEQVELCLFDEAGREERVPLLDRSGDVWHGYLPGTGHGQMYGYRVSGPYDPPSGQRHDPAKLLVDPCAKAITGGFDLVDAALEPGLDSAPHVPRSVVVAGPGPRAGSPRPRTPWSDTVLYELHVKGFTAQHPGVPAQLRGTYAGLAHPAALQHLLELGVTAVELLPVHHFVSEPHLLRRGLTNHWGYNTLGFFAPHAGYSSSGTRGEQVAEFRAMVRALHEAGLEVLLDVVYNHTAEGDETGPTLSVRGIDNASWYRLLPEDRSRYGDVTGCGSTVDLRTPQVLQTVLDSLRYWATEMEVDGFRFDLAPALARGDDGFEPRSSFLQAVAQDPVLSTVKLVAEPWDVGHGGYQLGSFPHPWSEWNDRYRETVREAWRGTGEGVRELASRLSGSSDLFPRRSPAASVNLVTAHDGFTLRDLTTYDVKHNEANGEGNRDGDSHNRSWNCGVEGETADPVVAALRRRQARNLLTTLLVSAGVPMITMGDELRRTQRGNNNAYCQDGPLSWVDWELAPDAEDLLAWVRALVALRRACPVLRQPTFLTGQADDDGVKDVAWFGPDGEEHTDVQWFDHEQSTLGMYLDGRGIRARTPRGEPVVGDSLLLVLHTGADDAEVILPGGPWATGYELLLDTADERPTARGAVPSGGTLAMVGRSAVLLRAERAGQG
ncbi:MAG: glycogen debranching protein GlgX [Actinomycetota bacterium]|nr:glycogen debranching protein GlgX [Actinomycetota bacterium]